jgi:hypothetical protein
VRLFGCNQKHKEFYEMEQKTTTRSRPRWEKPAMRPMGNLKSIVLQGGGKLSVTGGDPGENRKPQGGAG